MAFGCSEVPLPFLLPDRAQAERHFVHAHQVLAVIQVQLVLGFMHHDAISELTLRGESSAGAQRARRHDQTHPSTFRRKTAQSRNHSQKYTWWPQLNNRL